MTADNAVLCVKRMSEDVLLRNRYVLIRHGFSYPNFRQKIVSKPPSGILPCNGLTNTGLEQARQAASQMMHLLEADKERQDEQFVEEQTTCKLRVISSDFSRAAETARIIVEVVGDSQCNLKLDERLRERDFGAYDETDARNYEKVWHCDRRDDNATLLGMGIETPGSVYERTSSLIRELEDKTVSNTYVLVSHGDSLQILQTWFQGLTPRQHREIPHLNNCEVRIFDRIVVRKQ